MYGPVLSTTFGRNVVVQGQANMQEPDRGSDARDASSMPVRIEWNDTSPKSQTRSVGGRSDKSW